ncbi:hypothetical protein [Jiangella endophytica]|uniref:hypothetical protein n=1 Tax=Jiangella endophytica TaxID=1623398 RepID=UPI00130046AA|nr:hypothetical protein [Jiangella endophytica]
MRFDRAAYDRLSDTGKAAYLKAVRDDDAGAAPPADIAPEKAAGQEGFEIVDDD